MENRMWLPVFSRADRPIYLALAAAIGDDIARGVLVAGRRLPTQRKLADALGIDFTTVSRAYAEAARRGLVEGRVGQGTFVRQQRLSPSEARSSGLVDMSMNMPPRFDNPELVRRLWSALPELEARGADFLMRYQEPGGTAKDRAIAAAWLQGRIGPGGSERILVTAGAQGAFQAILGVLAAPGDVVCTEALTYPGFRAVAAHLRLELAGVEMDAEGMRANAFEAICRDRKPKALYCTPTLHNPTTRTMPVARRQAIIRVAREHGVPIIEDDAYGALALAPPPTLAALAPDLVYHVASLAKCLSPTLRVAYVTAPQGISTGRLAGAVRAAASMVSPLSAALAGAWIETGLAEALIGEVRAETARRLAVARRSLPSSIESADGGFHVWLPVPKPWTRTEFAARLQADGVGVVAADAFAVTAAPEAVRIGLGAPGTGEELERALSVMADLCGRSPAEFSTVV